MIPVRVVRGFIPGHPGIYDIYTLSGDTHIGKWVAESQRLDHDQAALPRIAALIKPDDVIYDVGAYIGDHTAYYASCVPFGAGQVFAFEPQPDAFVCLEHNTRVYSNVRCYNVALGDGGCARVSQETVGNLGARALRDGLCEGAEHTIRLDNVVSTLGWPNLIKVDVEGWECRVLEGGVKTLSSTNRPTLVLEVNAGALGKAGTSAETMYEFLRGYGYQDLRDLFTGEVWNPLDARPQFDVVCK
jgi:FkbM family methyltransferase